MEALKLTTRTFYPQQCSSQRTSKWSSRTTTVNYHGASTSSVCRSFQPSLQPLSTGHQSPIVIIYNAIRRQCFPTISVVQIASVVRIVLNCSSSRIGHVLTVCQHHLHLNTQVRVMSSQDHQHRPHQHQGNVACVHRQ